MTVQEWFDAYGASHRHPTNKRIHAVCVPAITVSLLALLPALPVPGRNGWWHAGTWLFAGALIFYARLSASLAIGMAVLGVAALALIHALPGGAVVPWALAVFAAAWGGQFVGHRIEGAKPSFFRDLQFLLIGPLWLLRSEEHHV